MKKREKEEDHRTYLSTSGGRYRVIHQAIPISPDRETASEALLAARHFGLKIADRAWDGDAGHFVPLETVVRRSR